MDEMKYFMVRPKNNNPEMIKNFLDNGVVAVGWSGVDLSKYLSIDDLFLDPKMNYLNEISQQTAGRHKAQIMRFLSINEGNKVVIPVSGGIFLAIATKQRKYIPEQIGNDQANAVIVDYVKGENNEVLYISRDSLSEGLQRRLRVRGMTISNLNEFGEEIEKYFIKGQIEKIAYSWNEDIESLQNGKVLEFKKKLLDNIRFGKTNLKTGGIGLENLVKELTELEGYSSNIPSKRAFPSFADADVIAVKADKFSESKLLFQIKHHSGVSGAWGISQLLEIKKTLPDDFLNHQLVFITSADIAEDVEKISEDNNIIVIDGEALVDWIYELIDKISRTTKLKLGIIEIPQILR